MKPIETGAYAVTWPSGPFGPARTVCPVFVRRSADGSLWVETMPMSKVSNAGIWVKTSDYVPELLGLKGDQPA